MILDGSFKVKKSETRIPLPMILNSLTITNPAYTNALNMNKSTRGIARTLRLYDEVGEYYVLPRGVANPYLKDLYKYGVEDRMSVGEPANMEFAIQLREGKGGTENQVPFVKDMTIKCRQELGVIGRAGAGFGKTITTLKTLSNLGRTALIVVHKEFLMNQWYDRILGDHENEPALDISPNEVGFVQQDKCDFRGKKIVIAMAQSLLSREYPPDFYNYFGTIVFDEVHVFGARTFRKVIPMFPARYRIGISATDQRKDGLDKVFYTHIGKVGAVGEKRKLKATVQTVRTPIYVDNEKQFKNKYTGRPDLNSIYAFLQDSQARNKQIAKLLYRACEKGRQVIVFSKRRKHLDLIDKEFKELMKRKKAKGYKATYTTGYYIGGMSEKDLNLSATRHVVLSTYQMAKEGLDIKTLNTCFLVMPVSEIEQVTGRILRDPDSHIEPMVIDFDDGIKTCRNMMAKRMREYKKLEYKLK